MTRQPPSVVNGRPITGVFVSSSLGRDDGSGVIDRPYRTLKAAIARSRQLGEPVVACAERYTESLEIVSGVSVIGNFDCTTPNWLQGTKRAVLESPTSPALTVTNVSATTRLEGFEVRAPDFGESAPREDAVSSIALLARDSASFEVVNVLLHAGTGAPGSAGTAGEANAELSTKTAGIAGDAQAAGPCAYVPNCNAVTKVVGPGAGKSICKVGASGGPGGAGGDGKFYVNCAGRVDATRQPCGLPLVADANTAAGGLGYCASLNAGALTRIGYGTNGAAGVDGPDGANGKWTLTAAGVAPGHGKAGSDGSPGQGGGGGGGHEVYPLASLCADGACPVPPAFTYASATGGGGVPCGPRQASAARSRSRARVSRARLEWTRGRRRCSGGHQRWRRRKRRQGRRLGSERSWRSGAVDCPRDAGREAGARDHRAGAGRGGAGQPALSKDGNAGVKVLQAVTGDSLPRYDF